MVELGCVCRYRTLAEETSSETMRGNVLAAALSASGGGGGLGFGGDLPPGCSNAALYLLLRAVDRVHAQTGRYPGAFSPGATDPHEDVQVLRQAAMQVCFRLGLDCTTVYYLG